MQNEVKVYGSIWTQVTVDPLSVMEAEYDSQVPRDGWIESKNGFYSIMDEDRGVESKVKEITEKQFNYLKSLESTIRFAKLARS